MIPVAALMVGKHDVDGGVGFFEAVAIEPYFSFGLDDANGVVVLERAVEIEFPVETFEYAFVDSDPVSILQRVGAGRVALATEVILTKICVLLMTAA